MSISKSLALILIISSSFAVNPVQGQSGYGLPVWIISPDAGNGVTIVDWKTSPPEVYMLPNSSPSARAGAIAAVNRCGEAVFHVIHSGINTEPDNLFIYDPEGNPLLDMTTPNGPGLNAKAWAGELQVIPVPGTEYEWYIIYPEWKSGSGAPFNDGTYLPNRIFYSRVSYECHEITVLERDIALVAGGTARTYTTGMALSFLPDDPDQLCLYATRRSSNNEFLSLDRFLVSQNGIVFDKNTGDVFARDWNLTVAAAAIEVSSDGRRIAINNRNQDTGWDDIFLFDAVLFSNNSGAYQGISLGQLLLQPDNQVLMSQGVVESIAYSNSSLYFLRNMERKIIDLEFSPSGEYLYFTGGGFAMGGMTNTTYLGQIGIGTPGNPAPYPYPLRLCIQKPPGPFDPFDGTGGGEAQYPDTYYPVWYIENAYDGIMYLFKRNSPYLYAYPNPDDPMIQQLIPGEVDLSDAMHPNILVQGKMWNLPDAVDGWNYYLHANPAISLGNDTVICQGQSVSLTPGTQFISYCWQDGSTGPEYLAAEAGLFWVEVIDDYGCFSRDSVFVDVMEGQVSLGEDPDLCEGDSIYLTPGPGYESYLWQDGSVEQGFSAKNAGLHWVEVTAAGGCQARDSIYVTTHQLPFVDLGPDTSIKTGEKRTLDAGPGFQSYLWQDGSAGQTFEVNSPGMFWVTIDNGQCKNSDTVVVSLDDCEASLFVPNCFTPNNDGYNDRFNAVSVNLSRFELSIFNRWGQVIFETKDPEEGWDGKLNGKLCPQGTYFFLIRYESPCNLGIGNSGERKGSVTLLL